MDVVIVVSSSIAFSGLYLYFQVNRFETENEDLTIQIKDLEATAKAKEEAKKAVIKMKKKFLKKIS